MTRFFLSLYDFFIHNRGKLFSFLIILIALLGYAASRIHFKEDISSFLPISKENNRINDAYKYVATTNNIIVYVAAKDSSEESENLQIDAIDQLAERLQNVDTAKVVKSLFYKADQQDLLGISSFITENLPYFLTDSDYQRMDSLITPKAIGKKLAADKQMLTSPIGLFMRQSLLQDPLQLSLPVIARLQNFHFGNQFRLYQDHLFMKNGEALLIIECKTSISETSENSRFLSLLDRQMKEIEQGMQGKVKIHSFSASAIAVGNANQIKKDTLISSVLAVLIVLGLLIYSFRNAKHILLLFSSVLFGGLFAIAVLSLIRSEVSIIAIGISSIIFGIAVNYPLHFIDHYHHTPNTRMVIKDIVEPLTIGNITTVGAFLSLIFISSQAMADLGGFASLLLIGTILFVLLFLPHLLDICGEKINPAHPSIITKMASLTLEKNRYVVWTVLILTVVLACFSFGTSFETEMQKINYMTKEQQYEYDRMTALLNANQQTIYCVTEGKTFDDALTHNESLQSTLQNLKNDGIITRITGINGMIPSQKLQYYRIKQWNTFWAKHRAEVIETIRKEGSILGFRPESFVAFDNLINREWNIQNDSSFFSPIKNKITHSYCIETHNKTLLINILYTQKANINHLESHLNKLNNHIVAFDAGSITRRMIFSLSDDFNYVLYVCAFIVFAFLILSMGRLELALISFIPLTVSWFWILGLMNIFDIKFNIVNIILATFIFGQGDDYTIFMTEGLMYEYAYRKKMLASYKNSIMLSSLIMFIGIGMLIFAKHPAIRSLAEVTIIGMISVVAMAYIFPPLCFALLTKQGGKIRQIPVTCKNLFATILSFVVFLVCSALITGYGYILFYGKKTAAKRVKYHQLLCKVASWIVFHIPQVRTIYENNVGETFKKPGVIICNHQSYFDLICIMMLTPKLVILTNDWVWHSPFYGRLIRFADFLPIAEGLDKTIEKLKPLFSEGYSVMIFPEGTRSEDCNILRFHRGAFYLAEKLKLDIIPVLIHGVGHVLPKKEWIMRKGVFHIHILNRITPNDSRFSNDYIVRSKEIRHFYIKQYETLAARIENADYYADLVLHNYIYKGPAIEHTVRKNLKQNKNYAVLINSIPNEGNYTINDTKGYGEAALLLALVRRNLEVTCILPDSDHFELASNCSSIPSNLHFSIAKDCKPNQ